MAKSISNQLELGMEEQNLLVSETNDVVFKMSKKIAQLTKVVYYLNTKTEDHSTEIESLIQNYEEEIDNVIEF